MVLGVVVKELSLSFFCPLHVHCAFPNSLVLCGDISKGRGGGEGEGGRTGYSRPGMCDVCPIVDITANCVDL